MRSPTCRTVWIAKAQDATDSIGNRVSTLAEKVDAFAANVSAQDAAVGGEIYELPER
jgi:hypothetical protein